MRIGMPILNSPIISLHRSNALTQKRSRPTKMKDFVARNKKVPTTSSTLDVPHVGMKNEQNPFL